MNTLDLFYLPAAVLTAPLWARKTRSGWRERLGGAKPLPPPRRPRLLLHAVSVGEVNALRGLVPELTGRGFEVVVSVGTDTGLARARELFERGGSPSPEASPVPVVRYPLDLSPAVRRFLDAIRPDAVGLVELELWPNFVAECERRGVPVAVINGRLSDRSFRGYRRFRRFLAPTFARLRFAAVQDETYAERFRAMGVPEDRVLVTDSMKWDAVTTPPPGAPPPPAAERLAAEMGIDRSRPLIVAGSTAPITGVPGAPATEEQLLHGACPAGVQLLCAPRRLEHFDAAFEALGGAARCVRRSAGRPRPACADHDRFLLDTIGELRAAYALADVAIVGRSFGGLHGSDPIEPASLGKPVVIGREYGDFRNVVEALIASDGILITSHRDVGATLHRLLADAGERTRMGENARRCVAAHQGATRRHADLLAGLLPTAAPA